MKKIIKITFKNAKLFPFDKNGKDFVSDMGIRNKRIEQLMFKEPITVHQISNMLHKMMGERPVPSFRTVCYDRQEDIFQMAQNSFLKINTIKKYNKKKDRFEFPKEIIRVKKSVHDGWNPVPAIFWAKIKKQMGDKFNEFIMRFSDLMGYNVLTKPFIDYKSCGVDDPKFNVLYNWLEEIKFKSIGNYLTKDGTNSSDLTKGGVLMETVVSGIAYINNLSGVIYVPVTEEQLERFIYNTATILDGGLAEIVGVYYEEELVNDDDFDEAIIVSEISDEKAEKVVW